MKKLLLPVLFLFFITATAHAQVGVRPKEPVAELFGGFSYAHLDDSGAGITTNVPGIVGSVAWNAKSWLQLVADTSYNISSYNGVNVTLYGNHYGPRFFYRERRWRISPFGEFLAGGSHINNSSYGTSFSDVAFSFKAGGGADYNISPHFAIRAVEADYYRTGLFGGHQGNLWLTTGFIVRFGGASPQ